MSVLSRVIRDLINSPARAAKQLPKGLWLVAYPPADDQPARLVAGRHLTAPSDVELRVVRDALLEALDGNPSRVVIDLSDWRETTNPADWHGHQITWRMVATTDAFSHDPERAGRVRLASEHRDRREAERRAAAQRKRKPAAKPGPEPML